MSSCQCKITTMLEVDAGLHMHLFLFLFSWYYSCGLKLLPDLLLNAVLGGREMLSMVNKVRTYGLF